MTNTVVNHLPEHVTDFDPPLYNVWKQSEIQSLYLVYAYTTGHIP
jgi:hypothetical protein